MEGDGNSRFSRGRKRIVDGTVQSLIPSESRTPLSLPLTFSDPLNCSPSLRASPSSSFHFCSFSSRFSSPSLCLLDLFFSTRSSHSLSPSSLLLPSSSHLQLPRWSCCVSIQRPHNRLLAHSVFRFLVVRPLVAAAPLSLRPLLLLFPPFSYPTWPASASSWSSSCLLARSLAIDKGMRPCPFSTRRETRPRRQGGVKEEKRSDGNGGGGTARGGKGDGGGG